MLIYGKSKYKCVTNMISKDKKGALRNHWTVNIKGVTKKKYKTEREAAIAVDMYFILKKKEPINILKRLKKE